MVTKSNRRLEAALAPHGFPHPGGAGIGFTPEDETRLARGWPALRLLGETVTGAAAEERALAALDAIDPTLEYTVPRDVAQLYLAGYQLGPNLFDGPNQPSENAARRLERHSLLQLRPDVDQAMLKATLRAPHCQGMGDVYGRWRFGEVMFLYEAFLGTEVVAEALVEHLLELGREPESWGFAGEKPTRTNAAPHHLALVLPWLCLRLAPPVVKHLRARLALAPEPDPTATRGPTAYYELLRRLAMPERPARVQSTELDEQLALSTPDVELLRARVQKQGVLFAPARLAWCLGTAAFAGKFVLAGHDAGRLMLELEPLKDPGVVRLVAHLAQQRAGKPRAAEWLQRHADYALPILQALAQLPDKKEQGAAAAAVMVLQQGAPKVHVPLTEEQVEAEIRELFAELGKKLASLKTKRAQVAAIAAAHERYAEIRSAGGHPVPEAYFTDCFGEFGLEQWVTLAL